MVMNCISSNEQSMANKFSLFYINFDDQTLFGIT